MHQDVSGGLNPAPVNGRVLGLELVAQVARRFADYFDQLDISPVAKVILFGWQALQVLVFAKQPVGCLEHMFKPLPVATAFIVGGLVILWVDRRDARARIDSTRDMTWRDALKVGFTQCAALIPGTSRSGATIIGGMFLGLSRKCATEFTFFLAIPTLMGATVYALWKARNQLAMADLPVFTVGFVTAFISAFICVRWLLRYISTHDFTIFAWYRIAFGAVILLTAYTGAVTWGA